MRRHYTIALLGAVTAAVLSGCAYQDPLALPDLGPPTRSSQQYPGYNPYYGPGSTYGYGTQGYGYGTGYRQGYDPYYYNPYAYGGRYPPQYYSPGVVYVPYPVPCVDANGNGRCDKRPPKERDNDGDGRHDGKQGGGRDRNPAIVPPRYQRDGQRQPGDGPRVQRDVTGGAPAVAIPPQAVPAAPSPVQVRPQQPPRRAAPAPQVEREPRAGQRRPPARGDSLTQEP